MKTTEMIAKVKDANEVIILNVLGRELNWNSMRDLGHTLYTLIDIVKEDSGIYRLFECSNGALILAPTAQSAIVGPHKISYPLEFDGFGELENWSKVTEEEATQLLTKAPVESPKDEPGVDLFKQVCDLLDLNYDDYVINDVNDEYAQLQHKKEDRYIDIMFDKGLVQIGHAGNSEPPRKLKISFATEPIKHGIDAFQVPDQRTGYEVKAS